VIRLYRWRERCGGQPLVRGSENKECRIVGMPVIVENEAGHPRYNKLATVPRSSFAAIADWDAEDSWRIGCAK